MQAREWVHRMSLRDTHNSSRTEQVLKSGVASAPSGTSAHKSFELANSHGMLTVVTSESSVAGTAKIGAGRGGGGPANVHTPPVGDAHGRSSRVGS